MRHYLLLLSTLALGFFPRAWTKEHFDENLSLQPLSDGKLLAHFEFTTVLEAPHGQGTPMLDYGLFPKAIGQVLQQYNVHELHLTFTQGRWNYEDWGYPPSMSAGTGVELWAWLSPENIDARWKSLTNTLSGLFCASLNFMDKTLTTEPLLSFRPEGIQALNSSNPTGNAQIRYGLLPQENVCTENLTPWLKLLPCKAKSGIAVLLNPHKIYNSNFHAMAVHATSVCADADCAQSVLQVKQTVTSVIDPVRETSRRDWSLDSIFDRILNGACPLADQSLVRVALDDQGKAELKPQPSSIMPTPKTAIYDLRQEPMDGKLNIRMQWPEPVFEYPMETAQPMITAHRYFTGYGQERGGFRVTIHNRNKDVAVPVIYFDSIPWFLKIYLHTLKAQVFAANSSTEVIQQTYYQPAVDRARPAMLECELLLPPDSVVTLSMDFEKVFLKYTEHRPDANRGFDVGPAVLSVHLPDQGNGNKMRVYTDTLLVSLPTPDFSMPYNVITLTCTVIALFFGSLFNLLTRTFQTVEDGDDDNKDSKTTKTE